MASRPGVSIRPSALGGKGALLFCALELAFLATDYSNLFFLLLAFSAILGVLGALWAAGNVRGVTVRAVELEGAAAGSGRDALVHVAAARGARFDLSCELVVAGERAPSPFAYAPMLAGEATLAGVLPPRERGVARFEAVRVTSRFPFGLFVARAVLPICGDVVTWPAPAEDVASGARADGDAAGDDERPVAGRGVGLAGLRPFRTGDALGDVHWKATARRGAAVVKERERDAAPTVEVVVDRRCAPDHLEAALARACAMVLAARHGAPLRLSSQGASFVVDPDRGGAPTALRWLAGAAPLPPDHAAPPPRSGALVLPPPQGGHRR